MYSRIVLNSFLMLKCVQIDDGPNMYLKIQPNVLCWQSDEHKNLLIGVLVPCLFIWCIAWPIFLLIKLYISHRFINVAIQLEISNTNKKLRAIKCTDSPTQLYSRSSTTFKNEEEILDSQKIYKYLTVDYVPTAYYWEFYFYITNFLFSSLAYSTSQLDAVSQAALLIAIFEFMLLISRIKSPFKFSVANDLQVFNIYEKKKKITLTKPQN